MNVGVDGVGLRNVAKMKKGTDRNVGPPVWRAESPDAFNNDLISGRKCKHALRLKVIQWLLPDAVAKQKQLVFPLIDNGQGKHPSPVFITC